MKLKQLTACTLAALTLMGCAHQAQPPSSYRFDYQARQNAEGVIRAFDDGRQTIVQFVDLERSQPKFADQDGKALEYEIRGQYAVLPEIVPHLTVSTTAGAASFAYTGKPVTKPAAAEATPIEVLPSVVTDPPTPARASVTNENAELAMLRGLIAEANQQLADIKRELTEAMAKKAAIDTAATAAPPAAAAVAVVTPTVTPVPVATVTTTITPEPTAAPAVATQAEKPSVGVYRLPEKIQAYFGSVGTTLQIDANKAEDLLAAAMAADRVLITGHADATGDRKKNEAIALSRAQSAKAYLVTRGIEDTKISTTTKGDRAPVATNNTAEGRALNRRVDFTFERK